VHSRGGRCSDLVDDPILTSDATSDQQHVSHARKPPYYDDSSSFIPVTMEMTPGNISALLQAAEATSKGVFHLEEPFGVVGLHTCGDLTCNALRVWSSVPEARATCVVGCCYHHVTEGSSQGHLGMWVDGVHPVEIRDYGGTSLSLSLETHSNTCRDMV